MCGRIVVVGVSWQSQTTDWEDNSVYGEDLLILHCSIQKVTPLTLFYSASEPVTIALFGKLTLYHRSIHQIPSPIVKFVLEFADMVGDCTYLECTPRVYMLLLLQLSLAYAQCIGITYVANTSDNEF